MNECVCIRMPFGPDILKLDVFTFRYVLGDAVRLWLNENIGHKRWTWDRVWRPATETEFGGCWVIEFRFWDKADAARFKLTWI